MTGVRILDLFAEFGLHCQQPEAQGGKVMGVVREPDPSLVTGDGVPVRRNPRARKCSCNTLGKCFQHESRSIAWWEEESNRSQNPSLAQRVFWNCIGCKKVGSVPAIPNENALDTMTRMQEAHRQVSRDCYEQVNYLATVLVGEVLRELREHGIAR